MRIMSERSERILKVAGFLGANYTLSPPITGDSSSIALSKDILWCWIIIIVDSNPLTQRSAMSSKRRFYVGSDIKFGASFASATSVQLFLPSARRPMPTSLSAGTTDYTKTKRLSSSPSSYTWMYLLVA